MTNFLPYLDFLIDVSTISERNYVIVVRSEAGEVRQFAPFPLTQEELATYVCNLEHIVLSARDELHTVLHNSEQTIQTFGRILFDFLLQGETRSLYYESLREAMHHNRGLRIKLSLHDPALATLPWEFLYDARRRDFVCLDPHTSLVRYTEVPQTTPMLAVAPPLQILAIIADPVDMQHRLDVQAEKAQISQAVRALEALGLVQLTWLEGQSWRALQRVLRTDTSPWHILHFIGHGGFDESCAEGFIILADEAGLSHKLYATQLARLLARQRASLRLVLLNACDGARSGTQNLFSSIAATLINSGVPAVLAMQYQIADAAAVEFATTFYEALADNLPVDAAVAEARNAINFRNARSLEWGVPVLHMRAPDGQLFALVGPKATAGVPRAYPAPTPVPASEPIQTVTRVTSPTVEAAHPSLPIAPVDDLLEVVRTAVQQQGTHVDLAAMLPAPELLDTSIPLPLLAPDQLDITDLLQSYTHRHHTLLGLDWVSIPAGDFWMGSDPLHDIHSFEDEMPQFQLYLPTFQIARIPVTNLQYKFFVEATGYPPPSHWRKGEIPPGLEKHPVVNVTWRDAMAFCEWAGVRLPTEAEWEKAARGQDGRIHPWGDEPPQSATCNFDLQVGMPVATGSYPAGNSPYGVWDMCGNIWEWTASTWLDSYEQYLEQLAKVSPQQLRRVLRGGGFRDLEFVRCAARSWDLATQRYRDLGFRVALD